MVEAVYFDGVRPRRRTVALTLEAGRLRGRGDEAEFEWPLEAIRLVEHHRNVLRLGAPDGGVQRLVVDAAEWEALTGHGRRKLKAADHKRERRLVLGLAIAGVAAALIVVFGIPAAARPLALLTPPSFEARIGRNMAGEMRMAFHPCTGNAAASADLDGLGRQIADGASLQFPIHVEAVHASIVNAFALPGGTILVTDKLIDQARSPDELAGVLAHEIAHIERRHVMQSVWESMGVGLVLDVVAGGGSGATQQAVMLLGSVTKQRFSRGLEREADERGIELLRAHDISSAGMANFFERMQDEHSGPAAKAVEQWFDSHPDSARRAATARAGARPGRPALTPATWSELRQVCARA